MGRLDGKVAWISGATSGIGEATARLFALEGAKVALVGRRLSLARRITAELKAAGAEALPIACDVASEQQVRESIRRTVKQFKRLDILVNNAGIARRGSVLEMSTAEWNAVLETHLTGSFFCARAGARAMVAGGRGGKIINIGSMYSLLGPPNVANYATAKTGMVGLTRALGVELAVHNIQANALLPGWHKTDINRDILDGPLGDEVRHKTPARRLGTPDDLVGAAIFLAAPASDFVTGTTLVVDGGYSITDRRWVE